MEEFEASGIVTVGDVKDLCSSVSKALSVEEQELEAARLETEEHLQQLQRKFQEKRDTCIRTLLSTIEKYSKTFTQSERDMIIEYLKADDLIPGISLRPMLAYNVH